MRQEAQQAYDETMKQTQGLFDWKREKFITLPEYDKATKFEFDTSPAELCDYLYHNTASPEQVYMVLAHTPINYLVQVQAIMKECFNRLAFDPKHPPQMITYANFVTPSAHILAAMGALLNTPNCLEEYGSHDT